jgi:MarR family transcriptional regulator, organic hydroperoxide resistance regulator
VKTSRRLPREDFNDCAYDATVTNRLAQRAVPPAHQLARAAYGLHAALERQLHDMLSELDLTIALADTLWQLDPALGPLSRRQLAERLGCDPSNVTFLVDRLEQRRLVTRARAGTDRRVKAMALTSNGIAVRSRLIGTLADAPMFSRLTAMQQRQLTALLRDCLSLTEDCTR